MKEWLRRPNPLPPLKPPPLSPSLTQQSKPSLSKGVRRKGSLAGGGVFRRVAPSAGPLLRKAAQHFALFSITHRKFRSFFPLLGVLSWNCGRGPPKMHLRVRSTRAPTLRGPTLRPPSFGPPPSQLAKGHGPTWRPRFVGLDVNVVWVGERCG